MVEITMPKHIKNKLDEKKQGKPKKEKVFRVHTWNHILLEGFCFINTDYENNSSKYNYKFDANKDIKDWEKVPNENYDPTLKPDKKPEYCKGYCCIDCIVGDKKNMCPHFSFSDPGEKMTAEFKKVVKKIYEEEGGEFD
jgi:hypothetical protein